MLCAFLTSRRLGKYPNLAFVAGAVFAFAAGSADDAAAGGSKMKTLLQLPSTGFIDGNAVSDTQGGYFIPWIDKTNGLEIIDVRPGKKNKWTIFATSPSLNPVKDGSISYVAPDGAGGANIANCNEQAGGSDVIANVHFSGESLVGTNYLTKGDDASGICQWTGIATWSPTLFYVSSSDGFSFNGLEQVAFASQWTVTPIALPGPPAFDAVLDAVSATELVGNNATGNTGTGELFTATISGTSATYRTLYALNAKLGSQFFSVAPTAGEQFIGSTLPQNGAAIEGNGKSLYPLYARMMAETGHFPNASQLSKTPMSSNAAVVPRAGTDGFTLDIVQGKKNFAAKKINADTGAFEQVSVLPDGSEVWEVAAADTFGDPSLASHYVSDDGKYKLQSKATIPGNLFPEQIIARTDGSADGLVIDQNTGAASLVNFSAGKP
jgi:hypothetical protein